MTTKTDRSRIGQFVRRGGPPAYRTDEWAQIVMRALSANGECWLVLYHDGANNVIPVHDPLRNYEFRTSPVDWRV